MPQEMTGPWYAPDAHHASALPAMRQTRAQRNPVVQAIVPSSGQHGGWLDTHRMGRLTRALQNIMPSGVFSSNQHDGSSPQRLLAPKHGPDVTHSHLPVLWALVAGTAIYSSACLMRSMVRTSAHDHPCPSPCSLCMPVPTWQALPQAQWRCGNPNCSRRGRIRSITVDGRQLCLRCGVWSMRHENGMWGVPTGRTAWWQRAWRGRQALCCLRDAGLFKART